MKRTKRLLTFLLCLTFVLSPLASAVEAGSQQETEVVPVVDADEQETATKPDEVEDAGAFGGNTAYRRAPVHYGDLSRW